jgi:hypothetical protein
VNGRVSQSGCKIVSRPDQPLGLAQLIQVGQYPRNLFISSEFYPRLRYLNTPGVFGMSPRIRSCIHGLQGYQNMHCYGLLHPPWLMQGMNRPHDYIAAVTYDMKER